MVRERCPNGSTQTAKGPIIKKLTSGKVCRSKLDEDDLPLKVLWKLKKKELKKPAKNTVLLLGDSILDNAYWNDVGTQPTATVLRNMGVPVIDRSTEEVTTTRFLKDGPVRVRAHYVKSRKTKGIPYDAKIVNGEALVDTKPGWTIPKKNRFVYFSIGGNDLCLEHNINIYSILKNVEKVAKKILRETGCPKNHLYYVIPYPLNKQINNLLKPLLKPLGVTPKDFYNTWVNNAKKMCNDLGIKYISLEHFTPKDKGPENSIPEPTKQGAQKIAKLIHSSLPKSSN